MLLNAFKSGIYSLRPTEGSGNPCMSNRAAKVSDFLHFKVLTPKQMLQRLPIAHAQIKAGNLSENVLNEICLIRYSLHRTKEITKKYRKI